MTNNSNQKFNIPISIDISIKTYQFVCIRSRTACPWLGRLKWILDIIWPLNQHFNLKNQRNRIKLVLMLTFLIGIICILLHRPKKLTLEQFFLTVCHKNFGNKVPSLHSFYIDVFYKLTIKILLHPIWDPCTNKFTSPIFWKEKCLPYLTKPYTVNKNLLRVLP